MASELHKGEGNELQKPKIVPEDISSNFQAESMTSIAPSLLSLWNEAYEVVKSQLPHQVQFYEQLIELGRIPDTSGLLPRQSMMEPEDAKFRFMDFSKRQQQLEKMISSFLEIGDSKHSYDDDQKFRASKLARNIIKSVVCNLPDAALPWAGLCLCIQKITESKLGSDETMSTITHIVSRMAWYNLLPSLLEDGPTRTTSEDKFMDEKRSSLRSRIIKLYQEIMLCEVQIIYHQFDHPHKEVLAKVSQDSSFLEEKLIERVTNAENALARFSANDVDLQIRQLVNSANEELAKATSNATIQSEERKRVLKLLDAVDPRKDAPIVSLYGNDVLEHLHQWLSSRFIYEYFHTERLLWVSGSPELGRKMIIKTIEQEYHSQNKQSKNVVNISFSFGGNGQLRLEDATSIVKSLIYIVQAQQPKLVKHLASHCTETQRTHTFGKNDMYALSIILCNMVKDEDFTATLFLIDGIDEIGGAIYGLEFVLDLIDATLKSSNKVKWLIASDSLQKHPKIQKRLSDNHHLNLERANMEHIFHKFYTPSKVSELGLYGYAEDFRAKVTSKLMGISYGNVSQVDITCEALKRVEPWHAMDLLDRFSRLTFVYKNPLYTLMKESIEKYVEVDKNYCLKVLQIMAAVYRPLHITELQAIVDFPPEVDLKILIQKKCFAFLHLCGDTVCFINNSARDFFVEGIGFAEHSSVLRRCLILISNFLSNDTHNAETVRSLKYALVFWVRHLSYLANSEDMIKSGLDFLAKYHSQWRSCLASFDLLPQASALLQELEAHFIKLYPSSLDKSIQALLEHLNEMKHVFRFHRFSQDQTRLSDLNALLFYPRKSITRDVFLAIKFPELIVPPITDREWSPVVHRLEGHSDFVRSCAYFGDGKHLISGSDDGSICIWSAETGILQHKLLAFNNYVYLTALSPNGLLAASDRWSIKIWNANTGMLIETPDNTDLWKDIGYITHLAISYDGSMLAVVSDGIITIWNLKTYGKVAHQDARYDGRSVSYVQFSNNNSLATVSGNRISVWKQDGEGEKKNESSATDNEIQTPGLKILSHLFTPDDEEITSGVTFSPDSKYIAAGTDKIHIWNWELRENMAVLSDHTGQITAITFSSDGSYLASSSSDWTVRIWAMAWEVVEQKPPLKLTGHSGKVFDLSFSPSQKHLVTCSSDKTLCIWDYETGIKADASTEDKTYQRTLVHKTPIYRLAISSDGETIASGSMDGLICLWEGKSGNLLRELPGHGDSIESLEFSKDSRNLVSASRDKTVRVWNANDETKPLTLIGHDYAVRYATFSPDSQFVVSCSDDRTLRVWNLAHENVRKMTDPNSVYHTQGDTEDSGIQVFFDHKDYVTNVRFSHDCKIMASSGRKGQILLWEFSESQQTLVKPSPKPMQNGECGTIYGMTLDHAGLLIASSLKGIAIWKIATLELIKIVPFYVGFRTFHANDSFPDHIFSGLGPISLPELINNGLIQSKPTEWSPYGFTPEWFGSVDPDKRWITWMGHKLIFWPKTHQPSAITTCRHVVIVGCSSGRLFYFKFGEGANFNDRLESSKRST